MGKCGLNYIIFANSFINTDNIHLCVTMVLFKALTFTPLPLHYYCYVYSYNISFLLHFVVKD